jgi:hypothetical protein
MNGTERCYLGAVALNNSGVSLVERGHYLQALTVLQDAMFAMREVSTSTASPSRPNAEGDDRSGPTGSSTVSAGEKARQKLGLDGMLRRSSRLLRDQASTGRIASCVKLASEVLEVDVPHLAAMRDCRAPDAALILIRIDATRCPDLVDGDDKDGEERAACPVLESIVILHNYAVAALLLPPADRALRRSAVNVTSVAFSIACGILNGDLADGAAASGGPFETLVVLQLAAMVAQSNYQLLLELDNLPEAWQSMSQLQMVRTALDEELHHHAPFMEGLGAPHAKAA